MNRLREKFLVRLVTVFALCASGASARTLSFQGKDDGVVQFVTPSSNIGCTYIPFNGAGGIDTGVNGPELHCYRLYGKFDAVSLGPVKKAQKLMVEGRLACCKTRNVLAFGNTWKFGGYACTSDRTGLTCRRGKHGFSISASSITRY